MLITPEIHHADIIFENGLAVAHKLEAAIGADAISIESVIYTHEKLSIASDTWFEMFLSPKPDWRRSTTGIAGHAEPAVARWFCSCYKFGSVSTAYWTMDWTKQIFLHGLVMPNILTVVHLTDDSGYDIADNVTAEVFYHEVYMGRDELAALDNKWGKYRRTS